VIVSIVAWLLALQAVPTPQDEPVRAPQLASHASITAMAYGSGHGIYIRVSHDLGVTFGDAMKVAEAAVVPINRHRGPRVAFSGWTLVVTAVVGTMASKEPHGHGLPSDGDLFAWRSTDDGRTWSAGIVINDLPAAAREGLHALAADAKGRLFAVWLDKRTSNGTSLYGARSIDGGVTWSKNVLIYGSPDGTICQCCHPSVAIDPAGQMIVMWRNWLAGNRDMYIARSADGTEFSQAEKIGTMSWQLNACPMDGGGIAVFQNRVITAWRREGTVYVAEPGQPETAIGQGKHVTIAAGAKGPYVVWVSSSGIEVRMPAASESVRISEKGIDSSLVSQADGSILVAWEEDGVIKTRR